MLSWVLLRGHKTYLSNLVLLLSMYVCCIWHSTNSWIALKHSQARAAQATFLHLFVYMYAMEHNDNNHRFMALVQVNLR